MAIQSLDQRLSSILPAAAPVAAPADPGNLEPMPGEQAPPDTDAMPTDAPGTPSMSEGIQVAGPADAAIRKLITRQATRAERNLVPEAARAAEGTLPDAAKAGRYKLIPEADQTLTDAVGAAVSRRQTFGITQGKPGGLPDEPFNLSRYQTEDAAAIVGGVADALNIRTKAVTFDEIKAKAAESGIGESFLTRLIGSDGKMMANAVETYKALEVLESSANELDKLFKLVNTGMATDSDKLMLRQQIALHGLIQKGVKGVQTETARALAVFRIPRDGNAEVIRQVLDEYGGEGALQQMARTYLSLESRAAKNTMIEKSMMSGVKDVWFTTWINGLLSSPVSHAKNVASNTFFGLYQIPERMVAALYSNALPAGVRSWRALVPGSEAEKIGMDEALTMVQSLKNGMLEGMQLASTAFKNNAPSDLMSKIEMQRGGNAPTISSGAFGIEQDKWFAKAIDYYGTAVTLPGRALLTEDEFFKGVLYRMEMNTQITRRGKTVYREGVEAGMSETDAMAKASLEIEGLFTNPTRDLDEAAMLYAQKGTFTAELPPALKNLQQSFSHPALKVMVPFFKTPANIGLQVLERTPFAPLSSQWREEVAKGGVFRDMALAKVTLGSAFLATFAALAAEGIITGSGPIRKADREAWLRAGNKPYSIKLGDEIYSYSGMEPVSALLAIASDYTEFSKRSNNPDEIEQVFIGAAMGLMEFMKEQPYFQGVSDIAGFLQATEGDRAKQFFNDLAKQYGTFVIGGSPAGVYGSLVAGIARLSDPTRKDTSADPELPLGVRGFVEAFNKYKSRLPYFNESLPESLNLWGDPDLTSRGNALELVLPTRVSPAQFSPVDDALVRIGSPVGMPDRKIDDIEMTAEQYNQLLFIYGKELPAKQGLMDVILSPGFPIMDRFQQQDTVLDVHNKYMREARRLLLEREPTLQAKIDELKEMRKPNGRYYKP